MVVDQTSIGSDRVDVSSSIREDILEIVPLRSNRLRSSPRLRSTSICISAVLIPEEVAVILDCINDPLAAGKYLGHRVYVELVTDARGYSATTVEYQITRWLSLLSSISTIGRESVNVRVSRDY